MELDSKTENILLELYKEFNKNRIDYNVRKWETVKFFESIFSALIVATIGGVITTIKLNIIGNDLVLLSLVFLPICAIVALIFGIKNLKRESRLLYMEEGTMFKILKILNLPEKIPEAKRWIPGDEFLLPPKYREYLYGIEEANDKMDFNDWLKQRTKNHKFSSIINSLFVLEIILSALLALSLLYYHFH